MAALNGPGQASPPAAAFTLIELLVVIAIMALVASLVVGLAGAATRKAREARVRTELHQLVSAIENYKARYGFYPRDNSIRVGTNVIANPVTNQLYYELTGTAYFGEEGKNQYFQGRNGSIAISAIRNYFNSDGFVNATLSPPDPDGPKNARNFLPTLKASQVKKISATDNIEILAVPVDWPGSDPNPPLKAFVSDAVVRRVNPWRYVSSSPTNNPAGFDLWAEIVVGGKTLRISNWEQDPVVIKP